MEYRKRRQEIANIAFTFHQYKLLFLFYFLFEIKFKKITTTKSTLN